ncbi:MAG: zf-HC2 domain-containing protein [Nitrospiraceae bacterium]|nr:MAG: zf-HC2 domain-containing protein [Nitrospiraceae bacterium]
MNCQWIQDNLSAYMDKELSEAKISAIREHVRNCTGCRTEYERMSQAWNVLNLWAEIEPRPDLRKKILHAVQEEKSSQWLQIMLPAAAVLLMAMSIYIYVGYFHARNDQDMAGQTEGTAVVTEHDLQNVNEDEIITHLELLRDKDFYDTLDTLEKIDYLPLVEEVMQNIEEEQRSSLECSLV